MLFLKNQTISMDELYWNLCSGLDKHSYFLIYNIGFDIKNTAALEMIFMSCVILKTNK